MIYTNEALRERLCTSRQALGRNSHLSPITSKAIYLSLPLSVLSLLPNSLFPLRFLAFRAIGVSHLDRPANWQQAKEV